jgi:protein gp37
VPEALDLPLRWKRPRRIFVDSMSDLFHGGVPDEFIDRVFAVMALTQRHCYQLLTKRPDGPSDAAGPWNRKREFFARTRDRKGADPSEWPKDLRVREFPEVKR